jgi:hypothetical protein
MIKIMLFLISFSALAADKYIFAVFHGYGYPENENVKTRTKISPELQKAKIIKVFDSAHNVRKKSYAEILASFECQGGIQKRKDLGLVILGYSWGAKKAYDFSKEYFEKCGRKADRAYMIDGVLKLVTRFPFAPIAQVCKNYYKTINPIKGRALKECENFDRTQICLYPDGSQKKGFDCHQAVILDSQKLATEDMVKNL